MPSRPKDEYREIVDVIRDFAARELAPIVDRLDANEELAPDIFKKLGDLGLLGITAPERFGGAGLGAVAACAVIEELAYVDPGTALSYLAHSILFVHNVAHNASEEQQARYLPGCITGELVAGLAMTEPGIGSDAAGMTTKATPDGNGWVLEGSKMFITNGPNGDVFLVYARTPSSRRKLTMFLVESGFPGFQKGRKLSKMGVRSSPTGELVLDECRVPGENLVGAVDEGVRPMMKNLDIERVTLAAMSVGIARACLDHATRYARDRRQFDKPIVEFQAVGHKIADMYIQWKAADSLVYEAAQAVDAGERARNLSAATKIFASEAATKIALDAIQVLGGYGYIREFPVERLMRDAKLLEIGGGTSEILRNLIIAEMLRNP